MSKVEVSMVGAVRGGVWFSTSGGIGKWSLVMWDEWSGEPNVIDEVLLGMARADRAVGMVAGKGRLVVEGVSISLL